MKLKYLIFKIVFVLLVIACLAICTYVNLADRARAVNSEQPSPTVIINEFREVHLPEPSLTPEPPPEPSPEPPPEPEPEYIPDAEDVEMLAKLIYGEARGIKSQTEQAAVVWCVLNRVDSSGYGMGHSVKYVVTFRDQFHGYSPKHPTVDDFGRDLCKLAEDVLIRWMKEKDGQADVGRILPPEYLWFEGYRGHNLFRDAYRGGNTWYWDLSSPYES